MEAASRRLDVCVRVSRCVSAGASSQTASVPSRDVMVAADVAEAALPLKIALSRKDKAFDGATHVLCLGEDKEVSTRHAVVTISRAGGSGGRLSVTVTDVGSTNGTQASGSRLTPNTSCDISDSKELIAGASRCVILITERSPPVPLPEPIDVICLDNDAPSASTSLLCAPARGESVDALVRRIVAACEAAAKRTGEMTVVQSSVLAATLGKTLATIQDSRGTPVAGTTPVPAVKRPRKQRVATVVPVAVPHAGTVTPAHAGGKRARERAADVMTSTSAAACALCAAFPDPTSTACPHVAGADASRPASSSDVGSTRKRVALGGRLWSLTADAEPEPSSQTFRTPVLEPLPSSAAAPLPEPEPDTHDLTLPRHMLPTLRRCVSALLAPVAGHDDVMQHLKSSFEYLSAQPFRSLMDGRTRMALDRLSATDLDLQLQMDLSLRVCDLLCIAIATGSACFRVEGDDVILTPTTMQAIARLPTARLKALCAVFGVDSNRMEAAIAVETAQECISAWLKRGTVAAVPPAAGEMSLCERVCATIRAHPDAHTSALLLEPLPVRALARTTAEVPAVKAVMNELGLSYSDAWRQ